MTLLNNSAGGVSYASDRRIGHEPERRSEVLAELRMTLDALDATCESHEQAVATTTKLLDMLQPGPQTDEIRKEVMGILEKFDALRSFNNYVLERVRGSAFKRMAELFDR